MKATQGARDESGEAMVCTGCGTTKTVEHIRATHPAAFTCCPERKMISVRIAITQAEARGRDQGLREGARAIEKANDRVMGIETPAMHGDNLAVILCSHFEDDGEDEDDNGWNAAAITGYEEVSAAIKKHYATAIATLIPGEPK